VVPRRLIVALALTATGLAAVGCASDTFQNRVYCSVDGAELVFVSWYHRVGVAAKVDERSGCQNLTPPAPAASTAR
jgi:hypothetical protein